jgi:anti-sigma factor RsiW
MTHLTEEQFEDVVQGRAPEAAHVAECQACRERLAEARAVRARLRSAFASVHASAALAERIRGTLMGRPAPEAARGSVRRRVIWRLPRLAWAGMAAAAAVLVVAIPVILYLTAPNSAAAAQAELARIHAGNLAAHHKFFSDADPGKLADYLKTQLGFEPATPKLGQGMAMRGCCVAHFKGQAVGSYVVETPRGPISIIVVPQEPQAMGMTEHAEAAGKTFWTGAFAKNSMVAVRLGGYTYCAVAEVPQDLLTQILLSLGLNN